MIPILIIGTGRSGTQYIARTLSNSRVPVGHEHMRPLGMASWYATVTDYGEENAIDIPFRGHGLFHFTSYPVILHQVRFPLDAICSFQIASRFSWGYIVKHISGLDFVDDPLILNCMKYWYYWNKIAEEKAEWTYRVESLTDKNIFKEFCERIGHKELIPQQEAVLSNVPTTTHTSSGYYKEHTWDELAFIDSDLCSKIISMGRKYGYTIE